MSESADNATFGIDCDELSLWYGTFQALHGVSTHVKPGIISALIGPSGCGKTTLLRCCNRMNERLGNVRTQGQVRIGGKNIYDTDVSLIELRKAVGMVFQRPNPLPLSISENILFGLSLHDDRLHPLRRVPFVGPRLSRQQQEEIVESALREVMLFDDLKDRLSMKATALQLEQQQKLCIARLLPLKPQLLLMDEPCSALDAEGTEAVEDLLRALRGRYTILIVTHNMGQASRVSDECLFMLNGHLVEHGLTEQVFMKPRDKRTEEYIEGRYG